MVDLKEAEEVLNRFEEMLLDIEDDQEDFEESYARIHESTYSELEQFFQERSSTEFGVLAEDIRKFLFELAGVYNSSSKVSQEAIRRLFSTLEILVNHSSKMISDQALLLVFTKDLSQAEVLFTLVAIIYHHLSGQGKVIMMSNLADSALKAFGADSLREFLGKAGKLSDPRVSTELRDYEIPDFQSWIKR